MKKKSVLLIIALLFVVGLAGYGVYSYYWAEGSFATTEDLVDGDNDSSNKIKTNKKFDLYLYVDGNSSSFWSGDSEQIDLDCSEVDSNGYNNCVGSLMIYNEGTSDVTVSYGDYEITTDDSSIDVSSIVPTFEWYTYNNNQVSGSTYTLGKYGTSTSEATLRISFKLNAGLSSEAVQVTEPVDGSELNVGISVDITATQVHGD